MRSFPCHPLGCVLLLPLLTARQAPASAPADMTYAIFPVTEKAGAQLRVHDGMNRALIAAARALVGPKSILTDKAIEGLIGMAPLKALSTCGDDMLCLAQIGTMLGAPFMIVPRLEGGSGGAKLTLKVALVDVYAASITRETATSGANAGAIIAKIEDTLGEVFGRPTRGTLQLALPAGVRATLIVDGQRQEAKETLSLPPGRHELALEAAGYQPYQTKIEIVAGATLKLDPQLEIKQVAPAPSAAPTSAAAGGSTSLRAAPTGPSAADGRPGVGQVAPDRGPEAWDWVGYGLLGGAGLSAIAWAIFGGLYLDEYNTAKDPTLDQPTAYDHFERARGNRTWSIVTGATAGVLGVLSLPILLRRYYLGPQPGGVSQAALVPLTDGALLTVGGAW